MTIWTQSREERTVNSVAAFPKSFLLLGSKRVVVFQSFGFDEIASK